jgi:hypothetical protein
MVKKETGVIGLLLFSTIIFIGLAHLYNNINTQHVANAHNFVPNTLSIFLTLVHRAQVELDLAKNNFPSNVTLALHHGENAAKLIEDAYYYDDEIVDDTDFVKRYNEAKNSHNATVHALVIANIADQILREYGEAFDIGYDLTNMSNMVMPTKSNSDLRSSSTSMDMDMGMPMHSNMAEGSDNSTKIVNMDNYQSAQQLSQRLYQIFENQPNSSPTSSNNTNSDTAVTMVEKSLFYLKQMINKKGLAQDLMMLVHGQLHPNLQLAYDLKLKQ